MRYTTVIDVTEIADIWRNPNISRLYFFMAMKCGFHDNDRDLIKISLRVLAGQTGLTLSACRHAVKVLQAHGLLTIENDKMRVTKFILDKKPTSRTQKNTATSGVEEMRERQRLQELEKERLLREKKELLHSISADDCREIIQRLSEKHRSISYRGVVFQPSETDNIQQWIDFKEKKK